ncbi:MAG: outer membrane protein assembly factor [Deltaproteobacteria bacterium]|nr:outer membrane protein assembly factor [Deltaproteobacteria bacterium]
MIALPEATGPRFGGVDRCPRRRLSRWPLLLAAILLAGMAAPAGWATEAQTPPARLGIQGLDGHPELEANVRAMVPEPRFGCNAPPVRMRAYLRQAREKAEAALRALGHFNAVIDTAIEQDGDCRGPVLTIDPGPVVRVEAVDIVIEGPFEKDAAARRWKENWPLKVGAALNQGSYDAARDGLINRAWSRGYLDARYTRRNLWVDPAANTARIELTLASGPRYRFAAIRTEQDILDDAFLRRLIPVQAGEPYSSDRLAAIGSSLSASGYFADVRVRPDLDARANGAVPVNVLLAERPRTGYEFRLGYGTDTGPRTRAEVERRWVNRSGHKWKAGVSLAQRRQTLDSVYSIPMQRPLTDRLEFYARADREDNNDIVTHSGTLGAQYARERGGWTQAVFTEYLYERTRYGDAPVQDDSFLLGGLKLGLRRLDDPLFPVEGHSLDLILRGAAEPLFSATSLVQGRARGGVSRSWRRFIFQGRAELGATRADDFERVPKSLRFFAGGDNSVRGYGYESLGPINDEGQVVGGRYLCALSAEAMYPVYGDDWFAAVFVDSGQAFDDLTDFRLKTGAGAGIRWRSPIGLVRLDLAHPFDAASSSVRLHIGIGADF